MINRFGWTRTTQASINFNVWRGRDSVRSELRFKRSNETLKHIRTWFQEIRRNTRQAIYARTLVRQTSSPSSIRAHIKDWLVTSCLVGYSRGLTIYNLQCIERGNLHVGTGNWELGTGRGVSLHFALQEDPLRVGLGSRQNPSLLVWDASESSQFPAPPFTVSCVQVFFFLSFSAIIYIYMYMHVYTYVSYIPFMSKLKPAHQ